MGLELLARGVLAPGAAAVVVALLLERIPGLRPRVGALAFVLALTVGFVLSFGSPVPLRESWQWPLLGSVLAGVAVALTARMRTTQTPQAGSTSEIELPAAAAIAAAGVGTTAWRMLDGLVPEFWARGRHAGVVLVAALLAITAVRGVQAAKRRFSDARLGWALAAWPALAAGVLMTAGTARGAQTAGLAAAALGGPLLPALARPNLARLGAASVPLAVLLVLLAAQHYGFGDEVSPWPMVLIGLPGALLGLAARRLRVTRAAWVEALALVLVVTLPLAAALALLTLGADSGDPYPY